MLFASIDDGILAAGASAPQAVQVDFDWTFAVQLVLPPGVQGVEAGPVVIPAGKEEATLVLKVPAGTAPGNRANLVVRAIAQFGKTPVPHEAKLSVNVVK